MESVITFPDAWLDSQDFEDAVSHAAAYPHSNRVYGVQFIVPRKCNIMVGAGAKLLSLANQLVSSTKNVAINFEGGEAGTMGYLNRMGFFDTLALEVRVLPERPSWSRALVYGGANRNLVEFRPLRVGTADKELPNALAESLQSATGSRALGDSAFTIFSELIQNVYRHSETALNGYAALQYYPKVKKVTVCVSDSGRGIMATLKPTLRTHFPTLADKADSDLLVEMVSNGVSRFGKDNGCGIRQCAVRALQLDASFEIRMPDSCVVFQQKSGRLVLEKYQAHLPLLWGTHICMNFQA